MLLLLLLLLLFLLAAEAGEREEAETEAAMEERTAVLRREPRPGLKGLLGS